MRYTAIIILVYGNEIITPLFKFDKNTVFPSSIFA